MTIVEVMGRNAGWLTATSVLAREKPGDAPHLIYLPEVPFEREKFVADVKEKMQTHRAVIVAISEGIHNPDGSYVSAGFGVTQTDAFGHQALTGASVLEHIVRTEIGCKCRAIELSLMQRCAAHLASETDLAESRILGEIALDRAIHGESGLIAVLNRVSEDPYRIAFGTVPASEVANRERKVPRDWINEAGNDVTEPMLHYLRPLMGEREVARPGHLSLI